MNKFLRVDLPFFGLKKLPKQVTYDGDIIFVEKHGSSQKYVLDDRSLTGTSYLERLFQMEEEDYKYTKLPFDATCRELDELVRSRCKWGISHSGFIYDLSNTNIYTVTCKKVNKVVKNFIWLKGISYPFQIPTNQDLPKDEIFYGKIVNIDKRWILLSITNTYEKDSKIHL